MESHSLFYSGGIVGKLWSFSGKNIKGFFFMGSVSGEKVTLMRGNVQPMLLLTLTACSKPAPDPRPRQGHLALPSRGMALNGQLRSPWAWEYT